MSLHEIRVLLAQAKPVPYVAAKKADWHRSRRRTALQCLRQRPQIISSRVEEFTVGPDKLGVRDDNRDIILLRLNRAPENAADLGRPSASQPLYRLTRNRRSGERLEADPDPPRRVLPNH